MFSWSHTGTLVRPPRVVVLGGCIAALAGASVLGCSLGAARVSFWHVGAVIAQALGFSIPLEVSSLDSALLLHLRLPRILTAALTGFCLGISGALLQGLFRNPLVEPGLIGTSGGAALGATLAIAFVPGAGAIEAPPVVLMAFAGALLVTLVVFRVGLGSAGVSVSRTLLAGIGMNALAMALIGLVITFANDQQIRDITFWTLGSLARGTQRTAILLLPITLLLFVVSIRLAPLLNGLMTGEQEASCLGLPVERGKRRIILVVCIGVGATVAVTGLIGFVGLVVPHVLRLWSGPDHRLLIPASGLLGATLLVGADAVARTVIAPAEIPIGVVTALIGAPWFIVLLCRMHREPH